MAKKTDSPNFARRIFILSAAGIALIGNADLAYSAMPKGAKRVGGTNSKGKGAKYRRTRK